MEGDDEYDALYKFLYEHVYPANINEKDKKRAFRRKALGYKVERGRLCYYHKSSKSWKQVPSEKERQRILNACHALPTGGHLGHDKTYNKVADRYHWKCMYKDIEAYIRTCEACQKTNDVKFMKATAPLHPIPVPQEVWKQVGIDLIGPLKKSRSGNRYIITLVDYFSKWPEAAAIPSKEAKEVAFFLFKMICRYGCIKIVISDQGREFVNNINQHLFEYLKTEHRVSTAYHPQTNELNSSDSSCYKHNDSADVEAMCGKMLRMKKTLFSNAAKNIKRAQTRQKEYYDKRHFRKKELAIGALVLMRNSAKDSKKGDKMAQRWLGPYKVVQILEKGVYKQQNPSTGKNLKKCVNGCRLKVFLKSKVTKHKKQLKSSQMSVDAKTEDLASQEKISGSPANLTRTSMLSGTVVKSVPSEKAAETVIDWM
ncbi:hypothetical protein EMCRGX_G024090 [Ephydatia muelleri]